jgi:hypothetical protein
MQSIWCCIHRIVSKNYKNLGCMNLWLSINIYIYILIMLCNISMPHNILIMLHNILIMPHNIQIMLHNILNMPCNILIVLSNIQSCGVHSKHAT